jgi:hypothetical protein
MSNQENPSENMVAILLAILPADAIQMDIISIIIEYLDILSKPHTRRSIQDYVIKHITSWNFCSKFFTFIGEKPKECTMEYWVLWYILNQIKWKPSLEEKEELVKVIPKCESTKVVASWNRCRNSNCNNKQSSNNFYELFQTKYKNYLIDTDSGTNTGNTLCPKCLHSVIYQKFFDGVIPLYVVLALLLKLTDKCSTQKVHYNGIKCPGDGCNHGQASETYIPGFKQGDYNRLCQCCQYKWFADNVLKGTIPISKCPSASTVHYSRPRYVEKIPACVYCHERFTCGC